MDTAKALGYIKDSDTGSASSSRDIDYFNFSGERQDDCTPSPSAVTILLNPGFKKHIPDVKDIGKVVRERKTKQKQDDRKTFVDAHTPDIRTFIEDSARFQKMIQEQYPDNQRDQQHVISEGSDFYITICSAIPSVRYAP
jgi:hypothetical protein